MGRIEVLKKHYEPRFSRFSGSSEILDWESSEAQLLRFRAMTDNIELEGRKVLDVGCGCGDLYSLLEREKSGAEYTGVDILEKMVDFASERFPDAEFYCGDIFDIDFCCETELGRSCYDITYASGIFNLNAGNNEEFLKVAVPVLAQLAGEAFVFNLLNPESPDPDDRYFYYSPEKAVELASEWAEEIKLIDGYLANDYTLICTKKKTVGR